MRSEANSMEQRDRMKKKKFGGKKRKIYEVGKEERRDKELYFIYIYLSIYLYYMYNVHI